MYFEDTGVTIKLTPGVWYWKDDTNTLEFASSNPAAEENLKEGKNTHFQEMRVKTLKRYFNLTSLAQKETRSFGWEYFHPLSEDHIAQNKVIILIYPKEYCEAGINTVSLNVMYWSTTSIFQDDCHATLPGRRLADTEGKLHRLSKWVQHEYVTLDDVKYAALLLKEASESHHMLSFAAVMRNEKLDEFLMALLFYLSFYLEKIALEKKCRSLISTMIFLEKKEMDDVLAKLAVARIHLAKAYCNLILGGGMAEQLHMPSGKRKTSLQKDRSFFELPKQQLSSQTMPFGCLDSQCRKEKLSQSELLPLEIDVCDRNPHRMTHPISLFPFIVEGNWVGFYNFCSYVAWLVFRRKHFQVIREEVGRLLCSNMFNPALRDRSNVDLQKAGDRTADANTARLPYLRKVHAKRPSINSMVHQRSPVLSTLLPLPKDSAQYFSQNHYCRGRDPRPCRCDGLPDFSELLTTKVGIIGAHCSELKSFMNMPDGMMEEEEEEEEQEQGRIRSGFSILTNDLNLPPLRSPQNRLSSQSTVPSRAMAE
ncbi:hypothetical protein QYF61_019560, partial [Mycteria americana]